jgi:hypothetical protein
MNLEKKTTENLFKNKFVATGPSSYEKKNLPDHGLTKFEKHWYRQCTYNVTMCHFRATIVAVETQFVLRVLFWAACYCQKLERYLVFHAIAFVGKFVSVDIETYSGFPCKFSRKSCPILTKFGITSTEFYVISSIYYLMQIRSSPSSDDIRTGNDRANRRFSSTT